MDAQERQLREMVADSVDREPAVGKATTPVEVKDQSDSFKHVQRLAAGHGSLPRPGPGHHGDDGPNHRLRGGAQRLPDRLTTIRRTLLDTGHVSEAEFEEVQRILEEGAQVEHNTLHSRLNQFRHIPPLTDLHKRLRNAGVLPVADESESAMVALYRDLMERGRKENKRKVGSFTSFAKFWEQMTELRVFAPRLSTTDPSAYWSMDAHLKSVLSIFAERGWPTANAYHMAVMKAWSIGSLDMADLSQSEEAQNGFFRAAVYQPAYLDCVTTKTATGALNSSRVAGSGGSDKESKFYNTFCSHHKKWYPTQAGHSTDSCARARAARG